MRSGNIDNIYKGNDRFENNTKTTANKKHIAVMVIWIIIAIFVCFEVYRLVMYTLGKVDKEKMWLYNGMNKVVGVFIKNKPNQTLEEHVVKVAAVGDIYATSETITAAKTSNGYNFSEGIGKIKDKLKNYDVVLGSLSTPIADKSLGYSSKNVYNTPVEILDTLKELNITTVATATNHAMDKNEKGITQTIKSLEDNQIQQIGLNSSEDKKKPLVISKNDINIGILSYATKSNINMPSSKTYLINLLDEKTVKSDVEYLKSKNVDYIIAYLNVPNEDNLLVSAEQKQSAEMLFNNGVNVVLGTGSMVIQEAVEDQIKVGDDTNHIYAIYSLGDFFGSYADDENKSSVIADLQFTKKVSKDKKGEIKDTVTDMKVNMPVFIWTSLTTKNVKSLYIISEEIESYNKENSKLSAKEYEKLKDANARLKELFK